MEALPDDWGTPGEPDQAAAGARLLHVVPTEVATFRHAFYETGAMAPNHRHECASLVYGADGPCVENKGREEIINRRLTFQRALSPRGTFE